MRKISMGILMVLALAVLALALADEAGLTVVFGPMVCINIFDAQTGLGQLIGYCSWIGRAPVWLWGG